MIGYYLKLVAPPKPVEEGRIALVIHNPKQVELLGQGSLGIQLGIGRPAAAEVAGLTVLGLSCGSNLEVPVKPSQAELQGCLGLQEASLLNQLVALQCDLLLQVERACIERGGGFKQGNRDTAGALKDLPRHWAPALALREGALMYYQVVTVQRQLLGVEQAAAAQQQAHIAGGQLGRIVDPTHSVTALPQRRNQPR